jgi:hypothetical protein
MVRNADVKQKSAKAPDEPFIFASIDTGPFR